MAGWVPTDDQLELIVEMCKTFRDQILEAQGSDSPDTTVQGYLDRMRALRYACRDEQERRRSGPPTSTVSNPAMLAHAVLSAAQRALEEMMPGSTAQSQRVSLPPIPQLPPDAPTPTTSGSRVGTPRTPRTPRLPRKEKVWDNFFGEDITQARCPCCFATPLHRNQNRGFERGHRIALARGGTNELDNLTPICAKCNSEMSTLPFVEYQRQKGYPITNNTPEARQQLRQILKIA